MARLSRPKREDITSDTLKNAHKFFSSYETTDGPASKRIQHISDDLGIDSSVAWRWVYVVRPFFEKETDEPWPHYEYPRDASRRLLQEYGYTSSTKQQKSKETGSEDSPRTQRVKDDEDSRQQRLKDEDSSSFDIDSNYQYNEHQDFYLLDIPSYENLYVFPGTKAREFVDLYSDYDNNPWTLSECATHFGLPVHVMEEIKRALRLRHKSPPRLREEFASEEDVDQYVQDDTAKLMNAYQKKLLQEKHRAMKRKAKKWDKRSVLIDKRLRRQAKKIGEDAPDYSPKSAHVYVPKDRPSGNLVCNWQDLHIGQRRYKGDTSLEQYTADLLYGADTLFSRAAGFADLEQITIVVGGDLSHVDTYNETTTRGTPQDAVADINAIEEACEDFMVDATDKARSVLALSGHEEAKVELVPVFGNHDRGVSYSIYRYLSAWFKNCADVRVPLDANERVYRQFENWLLAFTHGDLSKKQMRLLPQIMMQEARAIHADTEHMILYHGHLHEEIIKMIAGVKHHQAPSPADPDRYDNRNAYMCHPKVLPGHLILDQGPDDIYLNASILQS